MRRLIRTTGFVAAGFFLALGVASAADRDQVAPESRAYFGFSFGGQKVAPRDLHYGLRIDHDARFLDGDTATPLMQFDFTRRGLSDAKLNGLSVVKHKYRLQQSEEQAAEEAGGEAPAEPAPIEEGAPTEEEAPAEGGEEAAADGAGEGGFFSNMWGGVTGFFGGLFGGGDEEAVAEEAAPAEEAPAESAEAPAEEVADGWFASYDAVDWGLLAVGLAGVGLVASDVMGGDESLDLRDTDGDGIPDNEDPTPGGVACDSPPIPIIDPDGTPDGCNPNLFTGRQGGVGTARIDPEYQEWLDGGAGQMGDLVAQ